MSAFSNSIKTIEIPISRDKNTDKKKNSQKDWSFFVAIVPTTFDNDSQIIKKPRSQTPFYEDHCSRLYRNNDFYTRKQGEIQRIKRSGLYINYFLIFY